MKSHRRERGAALILLIGITAALAILAATLVMVLANQQHATAAERTRKTSQANAEGALDSAVTLAKTKTVSQTDGAWLTPLELLDAYKAGFDGGVLPDGMTVEFFVYDNSVGKAPSDANNDSMMWLEVVLTYRGKTTRMRVLIRQSEESVISAFPKAVVYSDTGISLEGTSDVYAIKSDGVTPWSPAPPYATTVMAGGGKSSEPGAMDLTANNSANLAAPASNVQSVNIQVNGSVSPSRKFIDTKFGDVGLLSDYFDQAAQADLGDEAQEGETHAAAPTAPTATPATFSAAELADLADNRTTTQFIVTGDRKTASITDLSISRTTTARTYKFRNLYVTGNLTLSGPVTVEIIGFLRVDGTLTVNNTTATPATDTISGPVYVAGTGSSSVAGTVTLNATSSLYAAGPLTMSNTAVNTGLLYTADDLNLTGNVTASSTEVVVLGGSDHTDTDFGISGATTPVIHQFGPIWVWGKAVWSGMASVQSSLDVFGKRATLYLGILDRSGTFNDIYGPMWCVGNAGTSTVAVRFTGPSSGTASTVMCSLLGTTEKTVTSGMVNFGTMTAPMVYYMMCDNDTLYSNTCEWGSTGTFHGLMVVMEARLEITGGNGVIPNVVGAVFNGTPFRYTGYPNDITLTGASTVAYNQAILSTIMNTSIRTTTTVTQIVPGSWQQLH